VVAGVAEVAAVVGLADAALDVSVVSVTAAVGVVAVAVAGRVAEETVPVAPVVLVAPVAGTGLLLWVSAGVQAARRMAMMVNKKPIKRNFERFITSILFSMLMPSVGWPDQFTGICIFFILIKSYLDSV
jgi:hypothetical protein